MLEWVGRTSTCIVMPPQIHEARDDKGHLIEATEFDYGAVEDAAGVLIEEMEKAGVVFTHEQAEAFLAWHGKQVSGVRVSLESEVLVHALSELMNSRNLKMDVHCLSLAIGVADGMGYSNQSEVADVLNCTRANVSKCVRKWANLLEIVTLKFRRNEDTRNRCAAAQTKHHWRNRTAGDFASKQGRRKLPGRDNA